MNLASDVPTAAALCLGLPILVGVVFVFAAGFAFARDQAQQQHTRQINEDVARRVRLDAMSQTAFRDYVCSLLVRRGYAARVVEIDPDAEPVPLMLLIVETPQARRLALTLRYARAVSPATLRLLEQRKAAFGCAATMVITSGSFREDARQLAGQLGCELVDRVALVAWILEAHPEWRAV